LSRILAILPDDMVKIAVVGSLNMDFVIQVPRFPHPGETLTGHDFHNVPGGKGANQAIAASRLGAQVSMVGRVGNDAFGQRLQSALEDDGVDTEHVSVDQHRPTGIAAILVEGSGENRIVVVPGANGALTPEDVQKAASTIAHSDILLLQLEVPLPAIVRAAEIAHQGQTRVILNPAPARLLPPSLLSQVDYLIPNEVEAAMLAGGTSERPLQAAQALRQMGVPAVVVTLGARGALLVDNTGAAQADAIPVRVVDTTAAGDAFVATFAVAIARGKPAREALHWANTAGALATTKLGAQPSLPTLQALLGLLAQ
jgi:ribokinase